MSQWIKCSERMPKPNKQVLAYSARIGVFFALGKNRPIFPWEYLDGDTCRVKVTHWMPLPEAPK